MQAKLIFILLLLLYGASIKPVANDKNLWVDFDISMEKGSYLYTKKYKKLQKKNDLSILKELYEKNNLSKVKPSAKPKIPKIIHQIWVGPNPQPAMLQKLAQTWKKKHPDWKYMFWTDQEVKNITLVNRELYDRTHDYREKADLLRYELLYQIGGVYVDLDFECLKPLDILNHCYDFYIGIANNQVSEMVVNALIGCAPGHIIMLNAINNVVYEELKDWRDRSGVFYFSKEFMKSIQNAPGRNIAFPMNFFYPIPYGFDTNKPLSEFIKQETMALHYYANSTGTDWTPTKD